MEKIWFFGVKSWFFTRNTPTNFVPPFARRNFFKCAPLTWNPGSAPGLGVILCWSYVQSTDRHVASIGLVILIPYPFCKLSGKVVFVFNWSRNELAVFEVIINYSHWDVDLIDKTLLNIFDFFLHLGNNNTDLYLLKIIFKMIIFMSFFTNCKVM